MNLDFPIEWLEPDEDDLYTVELLDNNVIKFDILNVDREVTITYYVSVVNLHKIYQTSIFFPEVIISIINLFSYSPKAIKRLLDVNPKFNDIVKELKRAGLSPHTEELAET